MKLPTSLRKESLLKGRRKVGTILTLESGKKALVIARSMRDIWRDKDAPYISQSMQTGEAGWSVETSTISEMKRRKIDILIIYVRQDKSFYATTLSRMTEHGVKKSNRMKNGYTQRTLGLDHFRKTHGLVKV